jgi:hypothetical protein
LRFAVGGEAVGDRLAYPLRHRDPLGVGRSPHPLEHAGGEPHRYRIPEGSGTDHPLGIGDRAAAKCRRYRGGAAPKGPQPPVVVGVPDLTFGRYFFTCRVHPDMKGKIHVVPGGGGPG